MLLHIVHAYKRGFIPEEIDRMVRSHTITLHYKFTLHASCPPTLRARQSLQKGMRRSNFNKTNPPTFLNFRGWEVKLHSVPWAPMVTFILCQQLLSKPLHMRLGCNSQQAQRRFTCVGTAMQPACFAPLVMQVLIVIAAWISSSTWLSSITWIVSTTVYTILWIRREWQLWWSPVWMGEHRDAASQQNLRCQVDQSRPAEVAATIHLTNLIGDPDSYVCGLQGLHYFLALQSAWLPSFSS